MGCGGGGGGGDPPAAGGVRVGPEASKCGEGREGGPHPLSSPRPLETFCGRYSSPQQPQGPPGKKAKRRKPFPDPQEALEKPRGRGGWGKKKKFLGECEPRY